MYDYISTYVCIFTNAYTPTKLKALLLFLRVAIYGCMYGCVYVILFTNFIWKPSVNSI